MTSVVILAALLARIRDLDSSLASRFGPALQDLKKIIQGADGNPDITGHEKANNFRETLDVGYTLENLIESNMLVGPRRKGFLNRILNISRQQREEIEKLCEELINMVPRPALVEDTGDHHALEIGEGGLAEQFPRPPLLEDTRDHHAFEIREGGRADQLPTPPLVEDTGEIVGLKYALTGGTLKLTFVSICGIRGTGKTTLAEKLFQSPQIRDHFEVCYWVIVSNGYLTRDIPLEILSTIPERQVDRRDAIDKTQDELAELISGSLKGRRYLIVLDDVCSDHAWFQRHDAFPDDNNGSRILITTPNRDVASRVGGPNSYIHQMRTSDAMESWQVWRPKGGRDDTEVNQKNQVFNVRPSKFNSTSSNQDFNALNLRYEKLPLRLRPCLLYLGTFPDDAEIEMDTLFQLWIAEGLISMEDKENEETMMDVAERYLDDMQKKSFPEDIVSGQSKSFRIGRQLRDFCRRKGKKDEIFEVVDVRKEKNQSSAIRKAGYLDKDVHYFRSFLLFNTSRSGTGIISLRDTLNPDRFMWVRVLCLYGVDLKYGKLPKGMLEKLVYLRYLSFRECYLEELSSSLGNMLYLQALDLRILNECELTVPNVLNNLKRLKYLYLPLAYRTDNHDRLDLDRLTGLEILVNFDPSLCHLEHLPQLTNLKKLAVTTNGDVSDMIQEILEFVETRASHLRSLSLNIRNFHCHSKRRFFVMEKVFNCSALDALEVRGYLGKPLYLGTSDDLKLSQIVLNSSEFAEDPMQILQKLPSLSYLVLEIEAYVGKEMKCSRYGFPQLGYLKLSKLYNLEEWEVEVQAMPKLCTLVIENCNKLKMLPDGLQFVTELEKLEIASMPDEFMCRIRNTDGTKGDDFYKIERAYPNVKIDGRPLIVQERQQGPREDPQSSSCPKCLGEKQEITELNSTETQE